MNRPSVELGDKVKDSVTGFTGIAIAITDWLNGCRRVTVQPPVDKEGKVVDAHTFDVEQLEIMQAKNPNSAGKTLGRPTATGGPHEEPRRNSDPKR